MNTPHPDLETLAELADRDTTPASETAPATQAEGPQTADPRNAELLAHVAGCAACTADLEALRRVRETLRALPPVPMPPEVAERIEAALLAARDSRYTDRRERGSRHGRRLYDSGRGRLGDQGLRTSRWRTLPYGAAASIVVLVAVVVAGIVALGHTGGDNRKRSASSPAIAAAGTTGGPATIASGTDYTSADLRSQVASVVTSNVPGCCVGLPRPGVWRSHEAARIRGCPCGGCLCSRSRHFCRSSCCPCGRLACSRGLVRCSRAAVFSSVVTVVAAPAAPASRCAGAANHAAITAPGGPLADPAALARCVQILAGKPEQPLLVDYALFNGAPSTIIVLPDPDVAHKLDIYVEADTAELCEPGVHLRDLPRSDSRPLMPAPRRQHCSRPLKALSRACPVGNPRHLGSVEGPSRPIGDRLRGRSL